MITGKTKVVGVIGDPVEHSLSPVMHNAAFEYYGLDYVYVPFHVKKENLKDAIKGSKALNIKGLNVTIPHKRNVIKYLDWIDDAAKLIGAINTIKFEDDGIKGFNTDGKGAVMALKEVTEIKNKKILILGAGGAARAVAFQLALEGAKNICILNRTVEKAEELAKDINKKTGVKTNSGSLELIEKEIKDTDILIDATPVGMYPNVNQEPLVKAEMMHENLIVNDLVYNPIKTTLLKEAEKAGAKTISGVEMLVYQGAEAFKIWTGMEAPIDVMRQSVLKELK